MKKTLDSSVLNSYPVLDQEELNQLLYSEIEKSNRKIVVLDDDPTGVQTVHDVSVYTDWTRESVMSGFEEKNALFYILTNSRGLTIEQTAEVHKEIAKTVASVSAQTGKDYIIMSRSDSTLRGHFPLETSLLREGVEREQGMTIDGEIICPFFKEGGRFTIDNVHYVKYGNDLIPAAQTEFAKDKTFGYTHSNICEYIEEKTDGKYKASDVLTISLDDIRAKRLDKITDQLLSVKNFNKIVVNAIDYTDIKLVSIAIYRALAQGKNFMFRTAAALVKEMGGITDQLLLTREKMIIKETGTGGVIVVGSHTQKTTQQLEELLKLENIVAVEFDSDLVLNEKAFQKETCRARAEIETIISTGKTAVVFTKRELLVVENDTKEAALVRSVKISDAVQSLVGELRVTPSFIIAKGGITSSDVGTKALKVKRADVMGQIRPGIPVWQTGKESKFPKIPYVIFPGNVGEASTLKEAAEILIKKGTGKMKIVVLDGYTENPGDLSWGELETLGEVAVYDRTSYVDAPIIAERIGDAEIVILNKTPITKVTLDKCTNIKLIAVLATGYNVVDYAYAKEKGIPVVNVPTYGTQIVGQYAVGLLLEICSHYGHHAQTVAEGRWQNNVDWCYWDYPMIELYEKTVGIIGLGRIGQTSARILKAMGMNVLAYDSFQSEAGKELATYVDLDTLYAKADVILLHCPLFPETEGMINKESIAKMKDGVILINNSRGQLVVEQDLADALNSGKVYAAAVDVVSTEPIKADNPLLSAKNCLITPHISWAAKEARQRIMDITVNNVKAYINGAPVNVVNK